MGSDENEGLCQYELDRLARIAENKKRMQEMGIFAVADALIKTCKIPKKPPKPRAIRMFVDAGPVRRSDRQQNKAPINYRDDLPIERLERVPRTTTSRQQRRVPISSKMPNFPIQSAHAIKLAVNAAKAKVEELQGRGFYKEMQPSNVSSGYWLQLPVEMGLAYRFTSTTDVELECHDACKHSEGWSYEKYPGEGRKRWHVRWLVRGGSSCGLSGGWRGFAIDQLLTWNDTVVFEVPEDVQPGSLPTYIVLHTFRAENYETEETQGLVVPAKEVYEALMAKVPDDKDDENIEEGVPEDAGDSAGADKAAAKKEAASLKAKKKRISEVAGSLKTAAAEHKRQRKAAAAAVAENDAAASEQPADVEMTDADGATEVDDGALDDVDAVGGGGRKKTRAQNGDNKEKSQGKAPVRGKENAKKPSGNKAAQEATEAAQEPAQEKRKSGRASEKKAPKAEKEEAAPPEPAVEEEGQQQEEEETFFVEQVLGVRKAHTKNPEFQIRWWGYAPEHDTWEPLKCLDDDPLSYKWADPQAKTLAISHAAKWKKTA